MKQITQGKFALVDDEDYEYLSQWKWYANANYATRTEYLGNYRMQSIKIHRVIMNTPTGMQTDHKNGNRLDNRKANLRICTHAQNQANISKRKRDFASKV